MALKQEFIPLQLDQLHHEVAVLKTEGWRFIQTHAVNTDDGIDLYYSFMKDGVAVNYRVAGVKKGQPVPSITDLFLAAFVFENEARELFGVDMRDIAIDFDGAMYAPAVDEPMTFISPEQKAAREKAKKVAQAKAAKAAKAEAQAASGSDAAAKPAKRIFIMTPERQARLDAKLATMSPEKVAKVKAALAARAAEAEAAAKAEAASAPAESEAAKAAPQAEAPVEKAASAPVVEPAPAADAELEAKLASLDPEKAAKVRAALAGKAAAQKAEKAAAATSAKAGDAAPVAAAANADADNTAPADVDEQVSALLNLMDEEKASVVRQVLNMKGGK